MQTRFPSQTKKLTEERGNRKWKNLPCRLLWSRAYSVELLYMSDASREVECKNTFPAEFPIGFNTFNAHPCNLWGYLHTRKYTFCCLCHHLVTLFPLKSVDSQQFSDIMLTRVSTFVINEWKFSSYLTKVPCFAGNLLLSSIVDSAHVIQHILRSPPHHSGICSHLIKSTLNWAKLTS